MTLCTVFTSLVVYAESQVSLSKVESNCIITPKNRCMSALLCWQRWLICFCECVCVLVALSVEDKTDG